VTELPPNEAPPPAPVKYLTEPLAKLADWVNYFMRSEIPVLASTAAAIEELRAIEDDVDAGMISAVIQKDPLMTLKLLAHVAARRRPGDITETETITSSLIMTGVSPFFRQFGPQPTVENQLRDQPKALKGLLDLMARGHRAAHFAMAFAVHRADTDVEVIYQAALLHDFAEMLMWCHAPTLQLEILAMQEANPTLRTASMQRFVYNIDLYDLALELMKLKRLPSLMVRISDGKHPNHPSVRNVLLATRLARHTMQGWDNAAIPDDVNDIAVLLNAAPRVANSFLRKIDLPPADISSQEAEVDGVSGAAEVSDVGQDAGELPGVDSEPAP
jgi:HD-like signal output (HDOD) protein